MATSGQPMMPPTAASVRGCDGREQSLLRHQPQGSMGSLKTRLGGGFPLIRRGAPVHFPTSFYPHPSFRRTLPNLRDSEHPSLTLTSTHPCAVCLSLRGWSGFGLQEGLGLGTPVAWLRLGWDGGGSRDEPPLRAI